jgi:hypothetical protein
LARVSKLAAELPEPSRPPPALDPGKDIDSISIRRHSGITRRTPSSYLSD